ncbi:MAG: invasin domain 3-containing protein, partial [Verrucomicrobiota bacterium]
GPGNAAQSTLTASPTAVPADGSTTATITVTLRDAAGNPVAGKSVSLTKTAGAGTPVITTLADVTDINGQGSWTVKSTTAAADGFTATDSTDDVTVTQTATVTFTAGVLHHYAITFSASPLYANTPFLTTITAQDINNNTVITNATVTMASAATATMRYEDPANPGSYYNQADGTVYRTRALSGGSASLNMQNLAPAPGVLVTATDNSSPSPITGSATIDFGTLTGAYRTWGTGGAARDWSGATTWQKYDATLGWQATAAAPDNTTPAAISILSGDTVAVAASSVTANDLHVNGQLTISNGKVLTIDTTGKPTSTPGLQIHGTVTVATGGTLTIAAAGEVQVFAGAVLENAGTINSTTGTLDYEPGSPGGKYRHLYTTGGAIPAATWDPGAVCEIAGYTSPASGPSGLNQVFYDILWNCASQTAEVSVDLSATTIGHNFTVTSTGSSGGALTLAGNAAVASGGTFTVSPNARLNCSTYVISGGYFDLQAGGTLGIGSTDGITPAGTAAGNIQTTTRDYSSGANYLYNGTTTPQAAGSGLPANVHQLIIHHRAGSGTVTLNQDVGVNDTLTLTSGALALGAHTLTADNAISTTGGSLIGGSSSSIVIGDAGAAASTTLPGVNAGLLNLTLNRATGLTLGGDVAVSGTLTLTSGALALGAHTLTLNNAISTTGGTLTGGATSALVIGDAGSAPGTT